ncbi:hypothetical protein AB0C28_51740 [Nonomuraea sp. NPDC048892]|uniref:hypothetical protein n=1 Tax=Nonomuraea sp. NPDC048892 TaxID=3154624 RepID=UPI0033EE5D10
MYFIHRDWEAGPLCKRVRHVPGRTVLEWFRGLWEPDGLDRAHAELDGAPYELERLRECGDTPPEDLVELRRRIRMELWADRELHIDAHSIRISSMGAFLEEAFYFADDERQNRDNWPEFLLHLRALVGPDDGDLAPAFERLSRFADDAGELPEPHDEAHRAALEHLRTVTPDDGRRPERTLIEVGEHLAQLALHADGIGHRPWYVFDDVWAGAHPDLAASLIHYAYHWDPGCPRRHGFLMPCQNEDYLDLHLDHANRVRDYEPYDEPLVTALTGAPSVAELRRKIFQDTGTGEQRLLLVLDQDHQSKLFGVIGAVLGHPAPDACELRYFHLVDSRRHPRLSSRLIKALCVELRKEGYSNLVLSQPPTGLCPRRLKSVLKDGTSSVGRVIPLTDFRLPDHYAW